MNGVRTNGFVNGYTHAPVGIGYEEVAKSAAFLMKKTNIRPQIGIICGSGLGGLSEMVDEATVIPYTDIPNFAKSTAPGHKGQLVFGKLKGKSVVCMQGRIHMYEGYHISKVIYPVRVMKLLGVEILIATNAAGGLNPNFKVGDIMIMKDHISLPGLSGLNALIGPNDERFGPRFPALSKTYTKDLIKLCKQVSKDLKYDFVREGVYLVQSGPCFETIAECRLFQHLGADVTGMSTVPEVSVATQMGMECFALSLVTNMCIMDYDSEEVANSEEVLEVGRMRGKDMSTLISTMVERMELKEA